MATGLLLITFRTASCQIRKIGCVLADNTRFLWEKFFLFIYSGMKWSNLHNYFYQSVVIVYPNSFVLIRKRFRLIIY